MVHLAPILDFSAANNVESYSWRNVLLLHAQIPFHYTCVCSLTVLQHSVWSSKAATLSLLTGKLSWKGWESENWLSLKRSWWKRYECLCESCHFEFELIVNERHNGFNSWGSAVVKYLTMHPLPFKVNFMLVKLSAQVFF